MKIVVNLITSFRLIFTFLLPLLKDKTSETVFLVCIILLFLTDSIDGTLARKFKVQTYFGTIMDVIADKALSIVLAISLIETQKIFIGILSIEVLIGILNSVNFFMGKKAKSSIIGKVKTWIVAISIIFGYMCDYSLINYNFVKIFGYITIIFQIVTFIKYTIYFYKEKTYQRNKWKMRSFEDIKYLLFDTEYYLKNNPSKKEESEIKEI